MTLLLDTHAWIWWVDQDRRLGAAAITALDRLPSDQRPFLSDISLWEVATLVELGRLELGRNSLTKPKVESSTAAIASR